MPLSSTDTNNTIDGFLKDYYLQNKMEYQLIDNCVVLNWLMGNGDLVPSERVSTTPGKGRTLNQYMNAIRTPDKFDGRQMVFAAYAMSGGGVGALAEGGAYAAIKDPVAKIVKYNSVKQHGRIGWTRAELERARSNMAAFIDDLQLKMDDIESELAYDINRQIYGDSTGILCLINGAATSATQTVDTPGSQYLHPGMNVDVYDGVTKTTTKRIIDVASLTSIVFEGSFTSVDNSNIARAGSYLVNSLAAGTDIDGLPIMAKTSGTLGNINSATAGNNFWKAAFYVTTAAVISRALLGNRWLDYRNKTGHGPDGIITTPEIGDKLSQILEPDRRFTGNEMKLNMGAIGVYFKNVPIIEDPYCPGGFGGTSHSMFFIKRQNLFFASPVQSWFQWEDNGSGSHLLKDPNNDLTYSVLYKDLQFCTNKRVTLGQQTGITTS